MCQAASAAFHSSVIVALHPPSLPILNCPFLIFSASSIQPKPGGRQVRVETKMRRHLARACQRRGFGWKRWSREWLYGTLGLFSEYRVSYRLSNSAVAPV
jgi:hypothetical protein